MNPRTINAWPFHGNPLRPTHSTVPFPDIGWAVNAMRMGQKVRRRGWNGRGMYIYLVPGSVFEVNRHPLLGILPGGTMVQYLEHVDMHTAQGTFVPWLCSQTDLLATDWEIA
jgi:hypothetical protein